MTIKHHAVAGLGELVGTFFFLFFAFGGTNVANNVNNFKAPSELGLASDLERVLYISLAFGLSLLVNAWCFFRISGGLFNPAVTVGLVAINAVPPIRGAVFLIAQLLGGIFAALAIQGLQARPGTGTGLAVATELANEMSTARGLFLEMFLTWALVFSILMLAVEKHRSTNVAPLGIGLTLFVVEMTGVYFTGGSVNPARSFGPCVATGSFTHYHWIYWIGPILGSLLAAGLYKIFKVLDYEMVNPGQDDTGVKPSRFHNHQHNPQQNTGDIEEGRGQRNDGLGQ